MKFFVLFIVVLFGIYQCKAEYPFKKASASPSISPSVSPSISPSPLSLPRTLTGTQWLAENGSLAPRYQFDWGDRFVIEINVENITTISQLPTPYYNGILVGSMQTVIHECFQLGTISYYSQLTGCKGYWDLPNGEPGVECVKSIVPYFPGRHTFTFSYNLTNILLYQDTLMIGQKRSPDVDVYVPNTENCVDSPIPLTVGAGFNTAGNIDYFANAKYYWLKIYVMKYQTTTWQTVGRFDFTSTGPVNNRTEFPNLIAGATDVLYFNHL